MSPDSLLPILTTSLYFHIDLKKKGFTSSKLVATIHPFLACRIVIVGLLRLSIKARQDIPEFSTAILQVISNHAPFLACRIVIV